MSKIKSWSGINKLILLVLIVWVVLAVIFGFTDLAISIAVVDEASVWGNFGADYGEIPGYALIALALATLLGSLFTNLNLQKIPAYVGIVVGVLFILLIDDQTYINIGWSLIVSLAAYVIITWRKDWKNYRKISGIIALLAVINPLLFVQITKILCGRIRFRDLTVPGYAEFTPWFLPPGLTAGGRSFPSGHTAMSFMFIPLLIPLYKMKSEKRSNKVISMILILIVIGWAIFVAASRVIVGAHYASDVLFSGGAACIITILLYKWIYVRNALK